jgi:protein-disulfide isomerase
MIRLWTVTCAALIALGLNAASIAQQAAPAEAPKAAPARPAETPRVVDTAELYKPGPIPEAVMGRDDAPVTIVEYASLTCPHCATFHNKTLPMLKKDYIDTGKVRFIFRDFPFDVVAMAGSMIARCAPKEKQFDVLAELFAKQEQWAFSKDPEKDLTKLALTTGFTQETFDACLQKQEIYDGVLAVRRRGHEAFQIDSTPTLFVNGVMYRGALTPEQMETALKPHLEKK